jgi:hypothetical protein
MLTLIIMQVPEDAEPGFDITLEAIFNFPPPSCPRSDASEVSLLHLFDRVEI